MQKLGLNQSLQQKLSPQQIQFIKLLQVPTAELEGRIEEELEINPALEEGEEQEKTEEPSNETETEDIPEPASTSDDVDIKDYFLTLYLFLNANDKRNFYSCKSLG